MIAELCAWLSGTMLSGWIQKTTWVIPMVQSVHILAIAVVMTSVLMLDLRVMGVLGRTAPVAGLEEQFVPPIWIALAVLLASGVVLIVGEPKRELLSDLFRLKMAMVIAVATLTLMLSRRPGARSKVLAFVSLLLWLAILTAGRWIAYTVDA